MKRKTLREKCEGAVKRAWKAWLAGRPIYKNDFLPIVDETRVGAAMRLAWWKGYAAGRRARGK
jgi:hypothetical protein